MSCDVGEVTERLENEQKAKGVLENELCRRLSNGKFGE